MRYSHMLLFTLGVSVAFGILLLTVGSEIRFNQATLFNNYVEDIQDIDLDACIIPDESNRTLCPFKTDFEDLSLGDWANFLGSLVIVTGTFVLALAVCGIVGVLQRWQPLLIVMLVFDAVAIFMQYYLLDMILDGKAGFHDDARDELKEKIATSYSLDEEEVNDFTLWFNAVQLAGECCGASEPSDYASLNYTLSFVSDDGRQVFKFTRPPTCCNKDVFRDNSSLENFNNILECSAHSWAMRSADKGCYNVIHKYIYDTYGAALLGFLMCMIIWEGIQAILLFMIILRPPRGRKSSSASSRGSTAGHSSSRFGKPTAAEQEPDDATFMEPRTAYQEQYMSPTSHTPPSSHGTRTASVQEGPQPFPSFAKESSVVGSDLNRVKSSEIW